MFLFYKGLFSLQKSDFLNLISTFSWILLSKKKKKNQKKNQLPHNCYKNTLYARLISDTEQVSVCLGMGGVGGCTGCFTKK